MKVKEKRLLGDKDYPLGHSLLELDRNRTEGVSNSKNRVQQPASAKSPHHVSGKGIDGLGIIEQRKNQSLYAVHFTL